MNNDNTVATMVKSKFDEILDDLNDRKELFVFKPDTAFVRNRKISFKDVLKFNVQMGRSSIASELIKYYNGDIDSPCETAYLKRRKQIKVSAFEEVFNKTALLFHNRMKKYNNYRIIAVDGSGLSTPYNPDEYASYTPCTDKRGHNNLYVTAFQDIVNGIYTDAVVNDGSGANESEGFVTMIKRCSFAKDCLFLGDRHFAGFNNFSHLIEKGAKFIFRAKDIATNPFLKSLNLPDYPFDIWVTKLIVRSRKVLPTLDYDSDVSISVYNDFKFDHFTKDKPYYFMKLRIVRFKLETGEYEVVITNLDRIQASVNELRNYYHLRWGIEVSFRSLKHNIGLLYFHSMKIQFQLQEIYGKLVLYNICAFIANFVELDDEIKKRRLDYKINMVIAFEVISSFLQKNGNHIGVDSLIKANLIPIRPGRKAPRKLKDQPAKAFQYR